MPGGGATVLVDEKGRDAYYSSSSAAAATTASAGTVSAAATASAATPEVAVPGATPGSRHHHHERMDSWPGNWHLVVSDDSDSDDVDEGDSDLDVEEERNTNVDSEAADGALLGAVEDSFAAVRLAGVTSFPSVSSSSPTSGGGGCGINIKRNVICVAHDGGEMGTALVNWTLRKLVRPGDRAMMVVHVTPSTPGALAAEWSAPDTGVVSTYCNAMMRTV